MAVAVHLFHHPHAAGNGYLVAHGGRLHDGAQLFRLATHAVFLVLLKHGIELEVVHPALAGQTYYQTAALGQLHMVYLQQVAQQQAEVVLRHVLEIAQGQYARSQFGRGHFAARGQGGHGLVVEQTVGQTAGTGRLHPFLLDVELYQGDGLKQFPGDGLGQQGAGLGWVFAYHEPHLRGGAAAARTAHALQKRRHGEGGVYLEGALQPADVDAEFQGRGGADGHQTVVLPHHVFGR